MEKKYTVDIVDPDVESLIKEIRVARGAASIYDFLKIGEFNKARTVVGHFESNLCEDESIAILERSNFTISDWYGYLNLEIEDIIWWHQAKFAKATLNTTISKNPESTPIETHKEQSVNPYQHIEYCSTEHSMSMRIHSANVKEVEPGVYELC